MTEEEKQKIIKYEEEHHSPDPWCWRCQKFEPYEIWYRHMHPEGAEKR
jgi:hypothetical protein